MQHFENQILYNFRVENYNESISAMFHYSYIDLFRGNKTIQWQPACPAWLSALTEAELDICSVLYSGCHC